MSFERGLLDKALGKDPVTQELLLDVAENIQPPPKSSHSLFKRVIWIKLPNKGAAFLGSPITKVVLCMAIWYGTFKIGKALGDIGADLAARAAPILINHTPPLVFKIGNVALFSLETVRNRWILVLGSFYIFRGTILRLPTIPYVTNLARKINLWSIFLFLFSSSESVTDIIRNFVVTHAAITWNACGALSNLCRRIALPMEREILASRKEHALLVWQKCFEPPEEILEESHS